MNFIQTIYPFFNFYRIILLVISSFVLSSCNSDSLAEKSDEIFLGEWRFKTNDIYDGITIKIEKKSNSFKGKIIKLNDNKIINFFVDTSFVLINDIRRKSNFQFVINENIIGKELLSLYGLKTTKDRDVELYSSQDTIYLKESIPLLVRMKKKN